MLHFSRRCWIIRWAESEAEIDVVTGDGHLALLHEPPESFDVIILDAFSDDAVPVHLLT